MDAQRQAGVEYGLWWLTAALALPVADVALLVGLNSLLLAVGAPAGWPVGLVASAALNVALLRWWGRRRLGVSGGVVAAAVGVSFAAAVLALVIFVVAVVAPALS